VVEDLGRGVERPDRRQPATDDTEVEGGDAEPGHRSGDDGVTAGEHGRQHDPPGQRDGDVGGASGDEEAQAVPVRPQDGVPDRSRRVEDVAAVLQRHRRGRQSAESSPDGSGCEAVDGDG
jgi:hypothetical protein